MVCLLIFISGTSVLHGLIPGLNKFTSKFLQNRVCPLSFSEFIMKKKNCFFFWTFITVSVAHFFV